MKKKDIITKIELSTFEDTNTFLNRIMDEKKDDWDIKDFTIKKIIVLNEKDPRSFKTFEFKIKIK